MAATQVFTRTNLAIVAAPPAYYLPNSTGASVPAGKAGWQLAVDLGGSIPSGQPCVIAVEYQRDAWLDATNTLHVAGEWLLDELVNWVTGSFVFRGHTLTIHTLASSIGATAGGTMVEPYPTHVRLRVDQAGNWTLPSVTLTLS